VGERRRARRHGARLVVLTVTGALAAGAALAATSAPAYASISGHGAKGSAVAMGRSEMIKISALPGRWTQSPYGSGGGGGGGGFSGGPASCNGLSEPGVDQNPPTVESPYFDQKGTNVEIQEEIDVYPTAEQAAKDLKFDEASAAQQCIIGAVNQEKASIAEGIGHGAKVGIITAQPAPVLQYDQGAVDLRLTIPIEVEGGSVDLYYDAVVIVHGRSEAVLDESNLSTPVPAALEATVDQAVARKL